MYDSRRGFETRSRIVIAFAPGDNDNLRFIEGAEPELPTFEVYRERSQNPGYPDYNGILTFDRNRVERRHWWSRLGDKLDHPTTEVTSRIQDFVDLGRGANNILPKLNIRLSYRPTSVIPVNVNQWIAIAEKQAKFEA